ncbi:MAG: hypothetical protein WC528_03035 [Patescibacteria group bacterium]
MRVKRTRGFILPLALIVLSAVAFTFFVWLSANEKEEQNVNPPNTNVVNGPGANLNAPQNSNQNNNQAAARCVASGCSGQVCAEEGSDIVTTCEIRDWFECLTLTKCERQADGQCGWTENSDYQNCLKEHK